MASAPDWMYARRSCVTGKRASDHLRDVGVTARETVDATKVRYGPAEALGLLTKVETLIVAKGTKHEVFDLKAARPDDETLLARMIGPTGNLRAPTIILGPVMVVGYTGDAYHAAVGTP